MKYKDLKEMNIQDWDGKPFYAIVEDDPEEWVEPTIDLLEDC